MADDTTPYPWTRRERESSSAYADFQAYLHLGAKRTLSRTAEVVGKSQPFMEELSQRNDWAARGRAYDSYLLKAEMDGHGEELARVRNRHLQLADKLLDHLNDRLDHFIRTKDDPSIRWTQAFVAATKAQLVWVQNVAASSMDDKIDDVMQKLDKLTQGITFR